MPAPGYGLAPYGVLPYGDPPARGLPTVQVLLDDGTGAFPFDITSKVRLSDGISWSSGVTDERSTLQAHTLTLTLDDSDGRFTYGSTVLADPSPIRLHQKVRLLVNGEARFTGQVTSWPVEWRPAVQQAFAQISASDLMALAERRTVRSMLEEEILYDRPVGGYYTLGDAEGSTAAADSSGQNASALTMAGAGTDVVFGTATGPTTDGLTAATFAAAGKHLTRSVTVGEEHGFELHFLTNGTAAVLLEVGTLKIEVDAAGNLSATSPTLGTQVVAANAWNNTTHHVALYRDATSLQVRTTVGGGATLTHLGDHSSAGTYTLKLGQGACVISHFAITTSAAIVDSTRAGQRQKFWASAVTFSDMAEALARFVGSTITMLSATTLQIPTAGVNGKSVAECLRGMALAESGVMWVGGSGGILYRSRDGVSDNAAAAAATTHPAGDLSGSERFVTDDAGTVTYIEVSREGGSPIILHNVGLEEQVGRYAESLAGLMVATDDDARNVASWRLTQYGAPPIRCPQLTIDGVTALGSLPSSDLGIHIEITDLPSQTPGGGTANFITLGRSESISARDWLVSHNVVPHTLYLGGWVVEDIVRGVLGETTKLTF